MDAAAADEGESDAPDPVPAPALVDCSTPAAFAAAFAAAAASAPCGGPRRCHTHFFSSLPVRSFFESSPPADAPPGPGYIFSSCIIDSDRKF